MYSKRLLVVLVVLVCSLHSVWSQTTTTTIKPTEATDATEISTETTEIPWKSCSEYKALAVDLETVKGLWYETGRGTNVNMQCKEISVPEKASEQNNIDIDISYVDSSDDKWDSAKKTVTFPWNTDTQNGIFREESSLRPITYKLISLETTKYAFFCGYDDVSTDALFMIWSRKGILSTEEKYFLQKGIVELFPDANIDWVEQSAEKCSSAMLTAGGALVALALGLLVYRRNI